VRLAVLHHLPEPFLGLAERPLRDAGLTLDERDLLAGDALPALGEVDGILSFGGSQSVVDIDSDPVLTQEVELLREAVEAGVPVLGICLGGQLLAHAMGGRVERAPRRTVAWVELEATSAADGDPIAQALGSPVRGLHWNEDRFELPPGATELLTRNGEGVTAFRAGNAAWGVQFHPEVDAGVLEGWYARYGAWLTEAGVSEADARAADADHLPGQAETAERLFGAFARVVSASSSSPAGSP
jgi:GMP synthase-like glutamine amidotransferase